MVIDTFTFAHSRPFQKWLRDMGLQFNPFAHLESASDPHLLRYTVVHEGLARVWESGNALIFAPVGGGKTALRLYATWNSLRSLYTFFAIPYVLPSHWDSLPPADFALHGKELLVATANAVLTMLLTFPQRFLQLPTSVQNELRALLWSMQPELEWILDQWQEESWEDSLATLLSPALRGGFLPPSQDRLDTVISYLQNKKSTNKNKNPFLILKEIFTILHQHLEYQSIHFLVDGVDAFFETNHNIEDGTGAQWLEEWLTGFSKTFQSPIFTKIFVPEMFRPNFHAQELGYLWPEAHLEWTQGMLVEMLRRRLYVASQGRFDSLEPLTAMDVHNLDWQLVQMASPPTPREVLWLANRLLIEHYQYHQAMNLLEEKDVRRLEYIYRRGRSEGKNTNKIIKRTAKTRTENINQWETQNWGYKNDR